MLADQDNQGYAHLPYWSIRMAENAAGGAMRHREAVYFHQVAMQHALSQQGPSLILLCCQLRFTAGWLRAFLHRQGAGSADTWYSRSPQKKVYMSINISW